MVNIVNRIDFYLYKKGNKIICVLLKFNCYLEKGNIKYYYKGLFEEYVKKWFIKEIRRKC